MNPELTGAAAPKAAAPKKKSNVGLIIAIIAAALIVAGGAIATVIILMNNNGGGSSEGGGISKEEAKKIEKPAKEDSAYYVIIDGKKFTNQSKLSDFEEIGYYTNKNVRSTNVPAGKYMIMIGGGRLTNEENDTDFSITPYNDGDEKVLFPEAKLGKIEVEKSSIASEQKILEKFKFFGDITLGSTREELLEVFGEPTYSHEYDNYSGGTYENIEFQDKTYKKFEFKVEDGVVTKISWTNYGGLNR